MIWCAKGIGWGEPRPFGPKSRGACAARRPEPRRACAAGPRPVARQAIALGHRDLAGQAGIAGEGLVVAGAQPGVAEAQAHAQAVGAAHQRAGRPGGGADQVDEARARLHILPTNGNKGRLSLSYAFGRNPSTAARICAAPKIAVPATRTSPP